MIQDQLNSYFVQLDGSLQVPPLPNPNLRAVLCLLQSHEELILVPLLMIVAGTLIFLAIWRNTRPFQPKIYPSEAKRLYVVKNIEQQVVFSVAAYDLDIDSDEYAAARLNFLGPLRDDDSRPSIAYYPWSQGLTVTSSAVESEEA